MSPEVQINEGSMHPTTTFRNCHGMDRALPDLRPSKRFSSESPYRIHTNRHHIYCLQDPPMRPEQKDVPASAKIQLPSPFPSPCRKATSIAAAPLPRRAHPPPRHPLNYHIHQHRLQVHSPSVPPTPTPHRTPLVQRLPRPLRIAGDDSVGLG